MNKEPRLKASHKIGKVDVRKFAGRAVTFVALCTAALVAAPTAYAEPGGGTSVITLDTLPDDVLGDILTFLPLKEAVDTTVVNQHLRNVAREPAFWSGYINQTSDYTTLRTLAQNTHLTQQAHKRMNSLDFVKIIAGNGIAGRPLGPASVTNTQLFSPENIAVEANGNRLVVEHFGHRVLRISSDGTQVSVFAGTGERGRHIDPNSAAHTEFSQPRGLAIEASGDVLVVDAYNDRVLRISPDGTHVALFAGGNGEGRRLDAASATNTQLLRPKNITVEASGDVLVTDTWNDRVLRISPDGTHVALFAGGNGRGNHLDPPSATNTQLLWPKGIVISEGGEVLVVDSGNHRVLRISPDGTRVSVFAGGNRRGNHLDPSSSTNTQLDAPSDIAIDAQGNVFVADNDNDRILRVKFDGSEVARAVGTGREGSTLNPDSATDTELKSRYMNGFGVAFDSSGALLVTDSGNSRVLRIPAKRIG
ncbi:MAG: hypothetical protein H0T78_05410 [Longispora sp.]|nr:hypothetical protein [Longispora sp. (in: high G+C Gram-positive bacteria)]